MTEWGETFRVMVWIVFVILCLVFMKHTLGGGAGDFIKTMIKEIKRLPFLRTERAGLNMAGGILVFGMLTTYIIFDSIGNIASIQDIATKTNTKALDQKIVLFAFGLLVLAGFFLLCVSLVNAGNSSDE